MLLKFKRIESIARSTEDIVNAVKTSQFPNLFEFNLPNCTQIRRLVAFDDIKLKNQYSNNPGNVVLLDFAAQTPDTLVSEHAVLALGFPVTTTEQEAWAHFSTYGSVKAVCLYQMQSGSENDNNDDDDEDALNGIDNDDRQRRKTGVNIHNPPFPSF